MLDQIDIIKDTTAENDLNNDFENENVTSEKEVFIPEKSLEIKDIPLINNNQEEVSIETNTAIEGEEPDNVRLIDRLTGFWGNKENTHSKEIKKKDIKEDPKISTEDNTQRELDIDTQNEQESILEIPAFLRRQVN